MNEQQILDILEQVKEISNEDEKEILEQNKNLYLDFFNVAEEIYNYRIEEGYIDIRKHLNDNIFLLDYDGKSGFGVKVGFINFDDEENGNKIVIDKMLYDKDNREFKFDGKLEFKINEKNEEKIKKIIDGAEITTKLIPYVTNTLGSVIEYDDGTIEILYNEHFDFEQQRFVPNINTDLVQPYADLYISILDFEKTVKPFEFSLLTLLGPNEFIDFYKEYVGENTALKFLKDTLLDKRSIDTMNYIIETKSLTIGYQGSNMFIDVDANNYNKFIEELSK